MRYRSRAVSLMQALRPTFLDSKFTHHLCFYDVFARSLELLLGSCFWQPPNFEVSPKFEYAKSSSAMQMQDESKAECSTHRERQAGESYLQVRQSLGSATR